MTLQPLQTQKQSAQTQLAQGEKTDAEQTADSFGNSN